MNMAWLSQKYRVKDKLKGKNLKLGVKDDTSTSPATQCLDCLQLFLQTINSSQLFGSNFFSLYIEIYLKSLFIVVTLPL